LCAVDEFHAFSGGDYDRLLSEDGKFGCSMLLATQNLKRLNKIRDGLLEMVFSTCDNVYAFNVSAADARLLEEEFRQVLEQKHFLSQPRLHCYARLSFPGYPVQMMSVALSLPPSWQHAPQHVQQAEAIRRHTQQHHARAEEIDRHYAQHLKQFLDVMPFVQKVHRDVQTATQRQQEREAATQLAEDVRQAQRQYPPAQASIGQQAAKKQQEQDGTPALIGSSLTGGSSAPRSASSQKDGAQGEHTRNHPRSKRHKLTKEPVGVPPPPPSQQPPEQDEALPRIPLHSLGGGVFWGHERERGE